MFAKLHLLDLLLGDAPFLLLHHEADELGEVDAAAAVLVRVVDHVLDLVLRRVLASNGKLF
jgi:hypothetical protein